METYKFDVNGHIVEALYSKEDIDYIFLPLLKKWTNLYKKLNRRIIVIMAAPPGCGKTTLSLFLEYLSKNNDVEELQAIGMDGFHRYQDYLNTHYMLRDNEMHLMKEYKGAPETFDSCALIETIKATKVQDIYWPIYSRKDHNPIENKILVNKNIILIEGNYLLLKDEPFNQINELSDDSIFIEADIIELEKRLVSRKMMGGTMYHEAKRFYDKSDGVNVKKVLNDSINGNVHLYMHDNRYYLK